MSILYKSGEKVFAKVRGYPFWPARIEACADETPNKVKYHVYFYGTAETAICKSDEVVPYLENKEKYGKPLKRKGFNEGLQQIQREINGGIADSLSLEDDTEEVESDDGPAPMPAPVPDMLVPNIVTEKKKKMVSSIKRKRESMDSVNEDSPAEVKRKHARISSGTPTGASTIGIGKTPPADGDSPSSKGKAVSRSGRKLKPKKFADEETEGGEMSDEANGSSAATDVQPSSSVSPNVTPLMPATTADTPTHRIRKSVGTPRNELSTNTSPNESAKTAGDTEVGVPSNNPNRVVLARAVSGDYVQIKLDDHRPATFENESARQAWDAATARQAEQLKTSIELGVNVPETIRKQLEGKMELSDAQKKEMKKESELQRKRGKLRWLKQEAHILELDTQIKLCLGLARADTKRCLQLMDDMLKVNIDPLMLKKHPVIVDTVKKLQRYIGNTSKWGMTEEESQNFHAGCEQIRAKATHMYHKFKKLFAVPKHKSFWDIFSEEVEKFNEAVKNMPRDKMYGLVVDPKHSKDQGSSDEEDATSNENKKKRAKSPKSKQNPQTSALESRSHSVDNAHPAI